MSRTYRVLIVDDDILCVTMLRDFLEPVGYEVLQAFNGREALKAIAERRPDLVLMDILMPVMDGKSCLKELKADDQTKNLPVLMLTAQSRAEDIQECFDVGAADYLIKPVERDRLIRKVDKALRKSEFGRSLDSRSPINGSTPQALSPEETLRIAEVDKLKQAVGSFLMEVEYSHEKLKRCLGDFEGDLREDPDARKIARSVDALSLALQNLRTHSRKS